ncbi:MAG: hypothetical protein WB586_06910 [Chthoniobacterales bacterium]
MMLSHLGTNRTQITLAMAYEIHRESNRKPSSFPTSEDTVISPPNRSTKRLAMAKPRPAPLDFLPECESLKLLKDVRQLIIRNSDLVALTINCQRSPDNDIKSISMLASDLLSRLKYVADDLLILR